MTAIRVDMAKRRQEKEEAGEYDPAAEDEGPEAGDFPWSKPEMLLASAIDELRVLRHLLLTRWSPKGATVPQPSLVPRPGVGRSSRPFASKLPRYQREMLLAQRRKNEESWQALKAEHGEEGVRKMIKLGHL